VPVAARRFGQEVRVALTPRAFDVLRYLVQHAGQLVTQDELLEALWPRACVQPEVLKHQVLKLRKALGDDRRRPRYIETLPRRGYWFIASTSSEVAETDSSRHVHREATALLWRALELTRRLPDAQRASLETDILEKLATSYTADPSSGPWKAMPALLD
jgi:DNA-binding winged helix-turn-helix (wHTH) protein